MTNKNSKSNNLITLAILSQSRGEVLGSVLKANGIEAYISNVSPIQPILYTDIRIRIRETDLPKALQICESGEWLSQEAIKLLTDQITTEKGDEIEEEVEAEEIVVKEVAVKEADAKDAERKTILLPVDFSEYSIKACEFGFNFAKTMDADIVLLHVYFTPIYAASLPSGDIFNYHKQGFKRESQLIHEEVREKLEKLTSLIDSMVEEGKLPKINYITKLREGIPEEEIIRYARRHKVNLVIMGTRGASQKKLDLIGSVTAEVIDRCRTTVFAIPEKTPIKGFDQIKKVAFLTNFEERDLIALDEFLKRSRPLFKAKISLLHITDEYNKWNEIEIGGIKEYLTKNYEGLEVETSIINDDDNFSSTLAQYLEENHIDIITLTTYRRNVFTRLFNPSIASKMVFHSDTPLLVINV